MTEKVKFEGFDNSPYELADSLTFPGFATRAARPALYLSRVELTPFEQAAGSATRTAPLTPAEESAATEETREAATTSPY
jgi:hypothetical protein